MKYKILLALFIIALIASAIMAFVPNPACLIGEEGGCSAVQNSSYASTFGIKNYFIGTVIFLFLAGLTYSQIRSSRKYKKDIIHTGIIVGTVIAVYFLYLQKFVLNAYCTYCLAIDFAMVAAFILIIFRWRK